jgi:hypothetical protein
MATARNPKKPGDHGRASFSAWCTHGLGTSFAHALLLAFFSAAANGCASSQLYTTAFSHRGAPEVAIAVEPAFGAVSQASDRSSVWLGDVRVGVRLQAGRHCDIGMLAGVPRIGLEMKCAFLQTKHHALAISAGSSVSFTPGAWANLPLLYTLRGDGWSITAIGGFSGYAGTDSFVDFDARGNSYTPPIGRFDAKGAYLRGGFSVEVGGNPRLQPEINVYQQLRGDRLTFVTFGVAFHLGDAVQATDPFPTERAAPPLLAPPPLPSVEAPIPPEVSSAGSSTPMPSAVPSSLITEPGVPEPSTPP